MLPVSSDPWYDRADRQGAEMVLLIANLIVWFLGLAPAQAASQLTCNSYMTDAVAKAQEAKRLRCGFSGPVWSTDGLGHKIWCQGANEDSVAHEKSERANALRRCESCRDYTAHALKAVQKNVQLKCGLQGARWHPEPDGHFRWCMGLNLSPSHPGSPVWKERDAREVELGKCLMRSDPNAGHTLGKRKKPGP